MESLALFVGIMFLIAVLSGPLALAISFIRIGNFFTLLTKRVLVGIFSVAASVSGALFIVSTSTPPAKLLGLFSLGMASLAVYRAFQAPVADDSSN
ncbi:MAG: hypothetical protein WCO85_05655 [Actinomycetes bacterium]|jgi:hypothetical protein